MSNESKYILSITPVALERCFLVADILSKVYNRHYSEYGLLCLAAESSPLHIIETPLLYQFVTSASVCQPSHEFFRLRHEIEILSKRHGHHLVMIGFVHRHPEECFLSSVDEEFLTGTLIDHVAATVTIEETRQIHHREFPSCRCMRTRNGQNVRCSKLSKAIRIEFAVAFSIVVNSELDFAIFAAKKQFCPFCEKSAVRIVPATLRINPERQLTQKERRKLKSQLEIEIEAKIKFGPIPTVTGNSTL